MESISPNRICRNCWEKVHEEDGSMVCECFQVSTYELSVGYQDYPDIWVEIPEVAVVFETYKISGQVIPCPKCGNFLTSLGLCSSCGSRYNIDRALRFGVARS